MYHIEVAGSPYEMGYQQGSQLKPLISAVVGEWASFHSHHFSQSDKHGFARAPLAATEEVHPAFVEELRGIADGAAAAFDDIAGLTFRIWNKRPAGCSNLGLQCADLGVVIGGTIDDPRVPYYVLTSRPSDGYAHICISWAGTAWAIRGINEAGLAIGASSSGAELTTSPPISGRPFSSDLMIRLALLRCSSVDEAVALVSRFSVSTNLIVGDATGEMAVLELSPWMQCVVKPAKGAVFCTNQYSHPELLDFLRQNGAPCLESAPDDYSVRSTTSRYAYFERFTREHAGNYSLDLLRQAVTSHENYPYSICNRGTTCTTLAAPSERRLYVAGRYACNQEWKVYSLQ